MRDTNHPAESASGRFVLRLPPVLHAELRDAARRAGLSLNAYCALVLSAPGPDPTGPGAAIAGRTTSLFGPDLVGSDLMRNLDLARDYLRRATVRLGALDVLYGGES